ncbi:[citrate (pro-3S)-lyase] ligase [Fusobacterium varium]|uniref:[citrate (pro-3S)-lyase] ligase n=1 Tax=Fusobacterium varium TaxID=856 RepID=UPI001F30CB35|nr:[citrate (pro-3S)-lyase] ligase [Fusobacterium varium]MCF2672550.1 [citrate (pro-3S)-lyase] ligase [Fusobacterium varium]
MNIEKVNLSNPFEKKEVIDFLAGFDLKYDDNIDYTVVIRENDKIIATASKGKNIVKCFAIDKTHQGEGISGAILTNVTNKMFDQGYLHSMVFTKTSNQDIFSGIGYKEVAHTDKVILMEMGINSIDKTINKIKKDFNIKNETQKAMLVMNCNPFTYGHQFLIEKAAAENEEVLIFVVQEDKSIFPFKIRYDLVKKGTAHLPNVKVIPGTEYIISSATFPNYFLRKEDDSLMEYTKLDATIAGKQFGEKLGINKRYIGEEPYCPVTKKYNDVLMEILPEYGMEVILVPRKELHHTAISASIVREKLKEGKIEELKEFVPSTTFDFLISKEGKEIEEKLKNSNSPH